MERTNSGIFVLLVYLLLAVYLFPLYSGAPSANELTDWATSVSLVEDNSLNIAGAEQLAGVKFESVVRTKDGVYSTRAPGLALLSAPFYALTRTIIGSPTKENLRTSWYVLRFLFGSLPLLLLGFWLYGREVDSYSLSALLFATPLFPYSLLYYSHVFAAILVYMAFRLIYDARKVRPETCFSAAFILGVAVLCEYMAVIPLIVIGIGLIATERVERLRRIIFFCAGTVLPFASLLLYQFLVFESPTALFTHIPISDPSLTSFYQFSVSPSLGILVFAPISILALFALLGPKEGGMRRHTIKMAIIMITFITVCVFGASAETSSIGPRHLILIMPLLLDSFFDGEIEEYPSVWRGLLFTVSFVFSVIPVLTYPFAPTVLKFPHNSFWVPLLSDGVYSFTLANTFGYPVSHWTIIPAAFLLLFVLFLVWRDAKYRVPFAIGILAGGLLLAGYFFALPLEPKSAETQLNKAKNIVTRPLE